MKKITVLMALLLMSTATQAQGQSKGSGEVNLYNWSNYFPPDLLKKFEKETGIRANLDVYDSNESLLAKLKAGAAGYDVVVPSDYMVKIMVEQGLLEKFDAFRLPEFKRVTALANTPPFDPARAYSAPYMWGVTGFSYDSARVPGGKLADSWKSFFEPPVALKGQIAALNDMNDMYVSASYYLNLDPCSEDPKVAQKVLDLLTRQKPYLAMYNSDGTMERMLAKEVIMHQQWNGIAHRTRAKLSTVVFVYPKEGLPYWNDNFAIPKTAKNKANAVRFIAWMMKPENIAIASNYTGYNNSIQGSAAFMDKSLSLDPAVNTPASLRDRFRANKICSSKATALRDKVWTRLKQ